MKRTDWYFTALLVTLVLISFSACSPGGIVESSETPKPTPTVVPTPTPTSTPSPTPTAEPTPTPTPRNIEAKAGIKKGQDKVEAEVNQRFQDFLNGTGEFTDEKIKEKAFVAHYANECLGYLGGGFDNNSIYLQGVLLYYQATEQSEIFALGTKNKKGERVITLVEHPSQIFLDCAGKIQIMVWNDSTTYNDGILREFGYRGKGSPYYNFLDTYINKPIELGLAVLTALEDTRYNEWSEEAKVWYKLIEPKLSVNKLFLTNIYFPDDSNRSLYNNLDDRTKQLYDAEPFQIITIRTLVDFEDQVAYSYDSIPVFDSFNAISLD